MTYKLMNMQQLSGALLHAAHTHPELAGLLARAAEVVSVAEETTANLVVKRQAEGNKIRAIKAVREYTGMTLKDAKEAVETGDVVIFQGPQGEAVRRLQEFEVRWGGMLVASVEPVNV